MKVRFLLLSLISFVLVSCASKKMQDRPRYDVMDNFTTKYNILFHGNKILDETELSNKQQFQPNFNQYLPIFIEPTANSMGSHTALMDSVILKANRIINEKNKGKYVRDAYFMLGKANYLKGNYYLATEYFDYLTSTFGDEPKYNQLGLVWQAKSLNQLGNLTQSQVILDSLFKDISSYRKIQGLAFATRADYYLANNNYVQAASMLEEAVNLRGNKSDKHRWRFLVGQLLQDLDYPEEASTRFKKIARSNVPYEMSFEAQLRRIFLDARHSADKQDQIKALKRMGRDDKNKDFKDQVEYHLAETYLQMGQEQEAMIHFARSLGYASKNVHQTVKTYMTLADFHLGKRAFNDARLYYDSAAMILPPNFNNIEAVQKRLAHMGELIAGFETVARQDTLLFLASLNESDRQAIVDTIIAQEYHTYTQKFAEQAKKSENQTNQTSYRSPFDQMDVFGQNESIADNRFYFNNPDALGTGVAGFRRKWGPRDLADNWRFGADADQGISALDQVTAGTGPREMESETAENIMLDRDEFAAQYWANLERDLPIGADQMAETHDLLIKNLQHIGEIYQNQLRQPTDAIGVYEDLLARYPDDHDHMAAWFYNLYLLHQQGDLEKSQEYRKRIESGFPESVFAQILKNPRYFQELAQQKAQLNSIYEEIYTLYVENNYEAVVKEVDQTLRAHQDANPQMLAQLAYLKSLAIGQTGDLSQFIASLSEISKAYSDDTLITPLVRQHLTFIDEHEDDFKSRNTLLAGLDTSRQAFLDEPRLTEWPQLVFNRAETPAKPRTQELITGVAQIGQPTQSTTTVGSGQIVSQGVAKPVTMVTEQPIAIKEGLLPQDAPYFFVIHVMHPTVNLAPSRFGIGQFNRTRYAQAALTHQLTTVAGESQLIYVGPFSNLSDAQTYESEFGPLMTDVMKIPAEYYQHFVITESHFGTLSDFNKIDEYFLFYQSQL